MSDIIPRNPNSPQPIQEPKVVPRLIQRAFSKKNCEKTEERESRCGEYLVCTYEIKAQGGLRKYEVKYPKKTVKMTFKMSDDTRVFYSCTQETERAILTDLKVDGFTQLTVDRYDYTFTRFQYQDSKPIKPKMEEIIEEPEISPEKQKANAKRLRNIIKEHAEKMAFQKSENPLQ